MSVINLATLRYNETQSTKECGSTTMRREFSTNKIEDLMFQSRKQRKQDKVVKKTESLVNPDHLEVSDEKILFSREVDYNKKQSKKLKQTHPAKCDSDILVLNCIITPPSFINYNKTDEGKVETEEILEKLENKKLKLNEMELIVDKTDIQHIPTPKNNQISNPITNPINNFSPPSKKRKNSLYSNSPSKKSSVITVNRKSKEFKELRGGMINIYKKVLRTPDKEDELQKSKSRSKSKEGLLKTQSNMTTLRNSVKSDINSVQNSKNTSTFNLKKEGNSRKSSNSPLKNNDLKLYSKEEGYNYGMFLAFKKAMWDIPVRNNIKSEDENKSVNETQYFIDTQEIDMSLILNDKTINDINITSRGRKEKNPGNCTRNLNKRSKSQSTPLDYVFTYNSNNLFNVNSNAFIKFCNTPYMKTVNNSFISNVTNNYYNWRSGVVGFNEEKAIDPFGKGTSNFPYCNTDSFVIEVEKRPQNIFEEELIAFETNDSQLQPNNKDGCYTCLCCGYRAIFTCSCK